MPSAKQGNPAALAVLGDTEPQVSLTDQRLEPDTIAMSDKLTIDVTLQSENGEAQELVIGYIILSPRADLLAASGGSLAANIGLQGL